MGNQDRREELLYIALELFATKGYHQTKVSDIVKQAGVAQGTFYWHFKSKEEIALEIVEKGKENLLDAVHQGYRQQFGSTQDMIESSSNFMKKIFYFAKENKSLMIFLLIKGLGADLLIRNAIVGTFTSIENAFKQNIDRAIALGMLETSNMVDLKANMLTSLVIGTITKWLFGPSFDVDHTPTLSVEEVTREMVQFEFFGLYGQKEGTYDNH
ncbi:TetR/AcrR family transcriptional regulator [Bacillus sp. FSL K6-3431]|uniref:TetR/AcrR family transcriptional regulator n=1 Tax=Bacillus sp. FSL K6-3431 TaxID=2921500 RepID=UPI0030F64B7D